MFPAPFICSHIPNEKQLLLPDITAGSALRPFSGLVRLLLLSAGLRYMLHHLRLKGLLNPLTVVGDSLQGQVYAVSPVIPTRS